MTKFNPTVLIVSAAALALMSGMAALGHQLLWTRRMVDLLGASAESTVRVYAAFFLGLAFGSAVGAWLAQKVRQPWKALGWAELACAALALPIVFLPLWSQPLWQYLGADALLGAPGWTIKLVFPLLLVGPPALFMGLFLPLLGKALFVGRRRLGREGLWFYGLNTLGGMLGLWLTAVLTLPLFGAFGAMAVVLTLNLIVATGCFLMAILSPESPRQATNRKLGAVSGIQLPSFQIGAIAFLSGFAILASETAILQLLLLVSPLSFHAPSAMLMVVLGALAVSAIVSPLLIRLLKGPSRALLALLIASAITLWLTPWVYFWLASADWQLFNAKNFPVFLLRLITFSALATGPLFLISGFIFPACCAAHDHDRGDRVGSGWGALLAINGIGGFLGAEFAYRLFLPYMNPYGTLIAIGLVYATAAGIIWYRTAGFAIRPALVTAVIAVAAGVAAVPAWRLPLINPHSPFDVLHSESGRSGTLAVIEGPGIGRGILLHNQYLLGNTRNHAEQKRLGSLPLLLHPEPREVAFIGLATGITPSAAIHHNGVQAAVAIEISKAVKRAAQDWFHEANHGVTSHEKVEVIIEDGRTFILTKRDTFDVVVGDLFLPWGPGEGRLYSLEHFRAVRSALKNGGLFFQWLPLHQLTGDQLEMILNTFLQVFPDTEVFSAGFDPAQPLLGLAGYKGGSLDWQSVDNRIRAESDWLSDPVLISPQGVALLYMGQMRNAGQAPLNTLNNMSLELQAGRRSVVDEPEQPYLSLPHWIALRERMVNGNDMSGLPGALKGRPADASQLTRLNLEVRANRLSPQSAIEQSRHHIPAEILYNQSADWRQWPGIPPWR